MSDSNNQTLTPNQARKAELSSLTKTIRLQRGVQEVQSLLKLLQVHLAMAQEETLGDSMVQTRRAQGAVFKLREILRELE
jgi:hypothetical protein